MKSVMLILVFIICIPNITYPQHTLSGFIDTAYVKSPVILAQKNNLKLSALDSALFRAGLKTQITSLNEAFYYPVINGIGYDEIITDLRHVGLLINFDKQVLFRGQMNASLNSLHINRNIAENDLRISEKDLRKTVTDLYLTAYGDYLQWQYNREILNLYLEEDTVFQSLTRSNIYRQNDYMIFITEEKKQQLSVNDALIQYRSDLTSLRYAAGVSDTSLVELADPGLKIYVSPQKQNSVFFRQYTLDSLRLRNEAELISFSYKPHLQLHADAGYLSSFALTPYKNFGAGIGMSLVIPVYDGRARQIKVDKVHVRMENLGREKQYFMDQYDLQTRQFVSLVNDLKKQNTEIDSQIDTCHGLIESEKKLLSAGQIDMLQYFVVMQNLLDLKNRKTINTIKIFMLINQINYLAN